jgi:SAM-dependent MidA family methyltransferase
MVRGSATETPLVHLLATRIRERGPITFAEYMRECLYHPEHGYYSHAEARRFADFYTSVDVHPIFGRLLARQLDQMWVLLGRPEPFWAVEAGAGTGRLAKHLLDFAARELRDFYRALCYLAVEQSSARRSAQAATLAPHAEAGRAFSAAQLPAEIPAGCVFSNELLDAFPVHRVVREQGALREIYVGLEEEEFCEQFGPPSTPALAEYFTTQGIHLLDGQQAEAGLAACEWVEDVGRRLSRGFVLTVDYGREARELYDERHLRGTLLAYQQHRTSEDFFRAPGEQDLTAHVNFTALDLWGRRAGLARTGLVSQAQFLLALGRGNQFADLYDGGQSEVERIRARLLLKNLIYPEGMGEAFQVLIQHKGIETPRLTGLQAL